MIPVAARPPGDAPAPGARVRERKPRWLLRPLPKGPVVNQVSGLLREHGLHTVCEEAACPNRGECWAEGEATLMIGGDVCTRGCRFCNVKTGRPDPLDPDEPRKVAHTVRTLNLSYVVITSVDRDELPDQGADHWVRVIRAIREACPMTVIDVLTPDFRGDVDLVRRVAEAGAHVNAHNIETVRRLHREVRDVRAKYDQSLDVLRRFNEFAPRAPVKSGIMVGLGETREELAETFHDLRAAGVNFLTVGQYLRPTERHLPVKRYVTPEEFQELEDEAYAAGFEHVVASPFTRSSYRAWEVEKLVRQAHGMPEPATRGVPGLE